MSFIIVFLMVSSILAIWQGTGSSSDIPSYNDYDISLDGNKYKIKSDFGTIFGYTYPSVLEKYSFDSSFVAYILSSSTIVVLFDPNDAALAYIEVLRLDLGQEDFPTLGKSVSWVFNLYSRDIILNSQQFGIAPLRFPKNSRSNFSSFFPGSPSTPLKTSTP